ncbi:MAG: Hpt domain-containing protein [Bacteroidota bacterium]
MNKHTYTHIDLSYLYEIADDDSDFVKEMITDYIQKVPEHFSELLMASKEQNFEQTHFIAHKIKSSFQFMGVTQLVDLASNIEQISETKDAQTIARNLATMEPVVDKVISELRHQLSVL